MHRMGILKLLSLKDLIFHAHLTQTNSVMCNTKCSHIFCHSHHSQKWRPFCISPYICARSLGNSPQRINCKMVILLLSFFCLCPPKCKLLENQFLQSSADSQIWGIQTRERSKHFNMKVRWPLVHLVSLCLLYSPLLKLFYWGPSWMLCICNKNPNKPICAVPEYTEAAHW